MNLSREISLPRLYDHIFHCMKSKTIHTYGNKRGVQREEELHTGVEQHAVETFDLMTGHKCPGFINNQLLCLFHL